MHPYYKGIRNSNNNYSSRAGSAIGSTLNTAVLTVHVIVGSASQTGGAVASKTIGDPRKCGARSAWTTCLIRGGHVVSIHACRALSDSVDIHASAASSEAGETIGSVLLKSWKTGLAICIGSVCKS